MTQFTIFSPPLDKSTLTPGSRQKWDGFTGSSSALCIANCTKSYPGLVLVLTENSQQAQRLKSELAFFCKTGKPDNHIYLEEFPDWETLPYDNFSPHQDIISQRLDILSTLKNLKSGILIASISTALHRLIPVSYLQGRSLTFSLGQELDINALRLNLGNAGYRNVDAVYEHGEFALRGSILDIFPMGSQTPYRIELFDNEIESLRSFDPETQISQERITAIRLLPGKEYPLDQSGIETFRQNFRAEFDIDLRLCPMYEDVSQGIATAGIEYYLPLFFPELTTVFDYLPENTLIMSNGSIQSGAEQFWREINSRYEDRRYDQQLPILSPDKVFVPLNDCFAAINHYPQINLNSQQQKKTQIQINTQNFPELEIDHKLENPLSALQKFLVDNSQTPILFCTDSAGRRETLLDLLKNIQVYPEVVDSWETFVTQKPQLAITVAPLEIGFWLQEPELIVITESQLFIHHVSQHRRRGKLKDNTDFIVKSLTELSIGAPVVHIDHGVGRYQGLQSFDVEGQQTEFLVLEYANQAKLYVPVSSLHLINRYSGADADTAPLHKLGSDQWIKARRKAAEKVVDVAAELLDIYARREAKQGQLFTLPTQDYQTFKNSFPFEETEDQIETIQAVIDDMTSTKAMDRLICGDVGFGKTEVALRAAFIAVHNHKQVAILVPTTLLAQQHFDNFKDRFADWPVKIALLSRFVVNAEQDISLKELEDGKIDIVIGTHKLLQPSVKYKSLGLLIIDEEHRFGVRQKEMLKALRADVDILTLTATPIPRTLNMAMSGMRDLSIIASPPARRLSIKTFIRQSNPPLIKEAILRELLRGGQVFFLHNEVKTIEKAAEDVRNLIPEARVAVAHGQLRERELERVMSEFYHKQYNVLVCSTIIETGIDIPNANTIIIERADKFGLAQLHQLRGRVGRSHHQAYAYMLTPPPKSMSNNAKKRVDAIAAADTLGAGFTLASHDLEIRGAGELLGDEQSGHIQTIGFSLYSEMLEQTIKLMKAGKQLDLDKPLQESTEINLHIPALIPDDYLPDVHLRLLMYKRIANARSSEELRELKVEMIDRFGLLPQPVNFLFSVTELKLEAEQLGIAKIEANVKVGKIYFKSDTVVDPYSLVKLVQEQAGVFNLSGGNELKFNHDNIDPDDRLEFVRNTLHLLKKAA
ncbi:transcription-repair coupling factor [Haliea sp. AH-315-K21]|uniref:Transcription-repair-coupling factor n=1 Tax=SAR86 cluster bacterium TaxID=2030880 RepID=A0A2A5C843_9GAMM|nr:transcription-repair coupling factor [Haliea sp. AH-315-K21]MBN4059713.1 transcription-repair coupling factor [bacterium AH-315-I11]MBN4075887.1 transcription-repair coupling factor [Gammaproteobacteria bacterium AH-315-E17]PCJ39648.1 MAG: transcription-repair coupling factor [SAR86 cluster bacterium]